MPKRKLSRRELPHLETLLDKLSFSKLPTYGAVTQRIMFEQNLGSLTLSGAVQIVKTELVDLWEYAGYGDILKAPTTITKHMLGLHFAYKQVVKCDTSRRGTESYKKKEAAFLSTLDNLFDITNASLRSSNLITEEDRDFLLNHWQNTISSTRDLKK